MTDALYKLAALQAAQGKAKKVRGADDGNREGREVFQRGPDGQQRALQALAGQQNGDTDKKRCDRSECVFHVRFEPMGEP